MAALDTALLAITADIVAAHVGNNSVAVSELPALIEKVYTSLASLGEAQPAVPTEQPEPAVAIRASIKPDHLICLEDGEKVKLLKAHLKTRHQLTPEAYRAKWDLPYNYPMVPPRYREHRRAQAIKIGLGKKSLAAETTPEVEIVVVPANLPAPARTRRPKLKLAL